MPVASGMLSMMTLALRSPCSLITYTLLATNSELTKTLPLLPWRSSRASSTPDAHVSTLKPGGSLNLEVGSLSAAVGMGNAGTGAIFIAASVLGRPLAQPGSSAGGGGGDAAPGVGCASTGKPTKQNTASAMQVRIFFMAI